MATMAQIREGLAAALNTIDAANAQPYMLASPTAPAMHVIPPAIDYDLAMQRGIDELVFTIQGFVALGTDIGAQKRLDRWRAPSGSESVKAAVEVDKTLGGVVSDLHVRSSPEPQILVLEGGRQLLSCDWEVVVWD